MKRATRRSAKTKHKSRPKARPLDPHIEDLRRKILFLNPYSGWIPANVEQRIMNIVDSEGEIIGELETGNDGFVQVAVTIVGQLLRISYYPGRSHASLTRTNLRE